MPVGRPSILDKVEIPFGPVADEAKLIIHVVPKGKSCPQVKETTIFLEISDRKRPKRQIPHLPASRVT